LTNTDLSKPDDLRMADSSATDTEWEWAGAPLLAASHSQFYLFAAARCPALSLHLSVGDFVALRPEDEGGDDASVEWDIGCVLQLLEDRSAAPAPTAKTVAGRRPQRAATKLVKLAWCYRPEETPYGDARGTHAQEIYATSQEAVLPLSEVRCKVAVIRDAEQYRRVLQGVHDYGESLGDDDAAGSPAASNASGAAGGGLGASEGVGSDISMPLKRSRSMDALEAASAHSGRAWLSSLEQSCGPTFVSSSHGYRACSRLCLLRCFYDAELRLLWPLRMSESVYGSQWFGGATQDDGRALSQLLPPAAQAASSAADDADAIACSVDGFESREAAAGAGSGPTAAAAASADLVPSTVATAELMTSPGDAAVSPGIDGLPPAPSRQRAGTVADAHAGSCRRVLLRAIDALQLANVPARLPCREHDREVIGGHLRGKLLDGASAAMYICGHPGTGKSALVSEIVQGLRAETLAGWGRGGGSDAPSAGSGGAAGGPRLPLFRYVALNALSLASPEQLYSALAFALGLRDGSAAADDGTSEGAAHAAAALPAADSAAPSGAAPPSTAPPPFLPPSRAHRALDAFFTARAEALSRAAMAGPSWHQGSTRAAAGARGGAAVSASSSPPARASVLVLIDEVDAVLGRGGSAGAPAASASSADPCSRSVILYNLFNWAQMEGSGLVLVCVGNALDLPERLEPKMASRIAQCRWLMAPYSKAQLADIARTRLADAGLLPEAKTAGEAAADGSGATREGSGLATQGPTPPAAAIHTAVLAAGLHGATPAGLVSAAASPIPVFQEGALSVGAATQAGVAGDVRRTMQVLQRAAALALSKLEAAAAAGSGDVAPPTVSSLPLEGLVSAADVRAALSDKAGSLQAQALRYATPWQRLLLITVTLMHQLSGCLTFTLQEVHHRMTALLSSSGVPHTPLHTAYGINPRAEAAAGVTGEAAAGGAAGSATTGAPSAAAGAGREHAGGPRIAWPAAAPPSAEGGQQEEGEDAGEDVAIDNALAAGLHAATAAALSAAGMAAPPPPLPLLVPAGRTVGAASNSARFSLLPAIAAHTFRPWLCAGMYHTLPTLEQFGAVAERMRLLGLVHLDPQRDHRHPLVRLRITPGAVKTAFGPPALGPGATGVSSVGADPLGSITLG
jgi:Cdc6-like AAA superfamily ATPase